MKAIPILLLLALALLLGGCATADDSGSSSADPGRPGDQPPGERPDGFGMTPGGPGFKRTF